MALTQDQIVSLIRGSKSPSEIQAAIQRGDATVPQLMSALQKIYASEGAQRTVYEDGEQPQTYTQDILYGGGFRAWENPPEIIGVTGEGDNQQPVYGPRSLGGFTQQIGDTLYVYDTKGQLLRTQDTDRSFGEQIAPLASIALMALSAGGAGTLLGGMLAPAAQAATQAALGGALLGGGMTALTGGNSKDILTSAIKGGIPAAIAPVTGAVSEAVGSQALGNALVSGALSKAQGGDFLQGAIMGGLSGAAKDATMNQVNQYLNTVEPGIPYDASTSPTELDVIQAFPELAPPPENLTQGVTDILNYAANAPAVQLAAAPNYVGELSGVPYDPNYVSDSGTGAYRLEIGGTGDQQGTVPSLTTVPTQEQAQLQIDDLIAQLEPYLAQTPTLEDIQAIIGQQNFATPEDVQTAINSIDIPQGLSESDVQNIVSNALANNPGLTAGDVQSIVNSAVSQIPSGLTAQDVTNILGQQNFATPDDIRTAISGIQFPENMTPEDVQNIVSEAFQNNPGITATDVQDIVQGALNNLPPGLSSDDVRNIVTDAVSSIPSAPTEQDIINIISGQNFATAEDIQTAINSIDIPQGLSEQDVQNIVSNAFASNPGLTANDVQTIVNSAVSQIPAGLTAQDVTNILGQQRFATPEDVQTAINSIDIPQGLTEQDVQSIVSDAFANNPGLTSSQVSQIVNNAISQIPSGITPDSVQSIVDTAISRLPAAPTQQDIINIIGGQGLATGQDLSNLANQLGLTQQELLNQIGQVEQGFGQQVTNLESQLTQQGRDLMSAFESQGMDYRTALDEAIKAQAQQFGTSIEDVVSQIGGVQTNLESQLNQQGRDFMDYLQQQGLDYETSLNEALVAQQNQFGTALNQTTEDLLGEIAASGAGLQQEFQTGLQGLANQLGITQQELIDQLNQAQESFGTQVGGLQEQFTNLGTTSAQQFNDLMKTIGLLGTGLGALQSTFKSSQEASLPKQFEIVAPPSEWRSPTYNMPATVAFTPQTPIDFGSPELLQGTQFARPQVQATQMPYDLSNVINTLNFESVPFVQQPVAQSFTGFASQPTAGVNNIIGNLNGTPVSIADIISNIQGQYGQKTAS